jgi:hypothetical protein
MIDAMPSEHILLESESPEPAVAAGRAGVLRVRFTLNNRIRRLCTEFRFYEEGYLGVRVQRGGYEEPERRFPLLHLDPRPALSYRGAETARATALYAIVLAALLAGLAYFSVAPTIMLPAAVAAFFTAGLAATVFVYRAEEQVQFLTRHGRVALVTLVGSYGCLGACRTLVPLLVTAIKESASRDSGDKNSFLRAEVREHYRLREQGLLSSGDCLSAVQRILGRFD